MNHPAAAPSPLVHEPGEYDRFMLRNPAEMLPLLRSLCEHVAQITVFFNEGQDMLLTTLAEVAPDRVILDHGPDAAMNRKALAADRLFCVTTLDKVRIQFILRGLVQVEHEGRPAFRAAPPNEVLRLQRREYYRLVTPIMNPLVCLMPLPLPDGSTRRHAANVFDISCGGLGLAAPDEGLPFAVDMDFPGCRLDLPEIGEITGTLRVRSLFDIVMRSGARVRRAGCEFVGLPGTMATLIQRYIIKVERERKARASGLG